MSEKESLKAEYNGEQVEVIKKTFSKKKTLLFCLFLGLFGAHRFYTGHKDSGVIMCLTTLSYFGLIISIPWLIIDLLLIITDRFTAKNGIEYKYHGIKLGK